ncbi:MULTISPECIES: alpha/beta hydrolase family protein [unclassified Undibacterium]|uniref:alpha/beta hydrolase family protein n=1 Tax=unclassified Undibacterium TaxID=2630295 RepID=UPI002AC94366|nr:MULTISPECIES: alpha/beta fold hydrolase [unclassified Undibacterium]MEB0138120.1 alpha/beta fold hydrolase [Undibacterium sp. CCC2.1]MEB0171125.1 alpha/beta fold hydrolase [Undibacterium sp. CCC1.1]MEB0175170.1 alpha/beta fold hydrolase [Undibacterium sp. CCC3.4]MEB0214246.1 alpha/beta fold hydrolase [Undibacterium sp. 5I2]WPX41826.1 alpha/beta fold hydrolase [Undibacterium sp. CCC3.4]
MNTFCHPIHSLLLLSVFLLTPLSAFSMSNADSIPIEHFFKNPQLSQVRLSPDGSHLALLAAGQNDRQVLAVMKIEKLQASIVAAYDKTDVVFFDWVNNQRLVFGVGDRDLGVGEQSKGNGLFAVNVDGSGFRQLIETATDITSAGGKFRTLNALHSFVDITHVNGSNDIFVGRASGTKKNPTISLLKLNTVNGYHEIVPTPSNANGYLIDRSGEVRVAITTNDHITGIHYKDPDTQQWRLLIEFDSVKEAGYKPVSIGLDGSLYVQATNRKNTQAIYRYDLKNQRLPALALLESRDFDLDGRFIYNADEAKLLGIHYESDAAATIWFSDKWREIQKTIDAALPNTINQLSLPEEKSSAVVLVHTFSDVHPGAYFLFHTDTRTLTPIGDRYADIRPEQMSSKDFFKIQARDGMLIPTYLSLPKNGPKQQLPMVVLVHGGPYVRGGHWNWEREVQYLTSRGYAVLQPDFRGSTGYGEKLFKAGWKQWGLTMQDDVTDATRWAIAEGYADRQRICIAGASYGGYATLMGLIKEPELYRCGISWVGVTDINYLFDISWSDTAGTIWSRFGMSAMIGDQVNDAAQFSATSPLVQAHRLKKPLILAYGAADRRVPLIHGEKFLAAAPKEVPIEWISYAEEGHGWRTLKNNVDFWQRAEKFLDLHTRVD